MDIPGASPRPGQFLVASSRGHHLAGFGSGIAGSFGRCYSPFELRGDFAGSSISGRRRLCTLEGAVFDVLCLRKM